MVKVELKSLKLHSNSSYLSLLVLNLAYGISRLQYFKFEGLDFSGCLTSNTVATKIPVNNKNGLLSIGHWALKWCIRRMCRLDTSKWIVKTIITNWNSQNHHQMLGRFLCFTTSNCGKYYWKLLGLEAGDLEFHTLIFIKQVLFFLVATWFLNCTSVYL